jgi:hypothetical protein
MRLGDEGAAEWDEVVVGLAVGANLCGRADGAGLDAAVGMAAGSSAAVAGD